VVNRPDSINSLEAAGAVSTCLQALRVTGDNRWRGQAWSAFNWFLGDNDLRLPLYDSATGGCRDGLHPRARQSESGSGIHTVFSDGTFGNALTANTRKGGRLVMTAPETTLVNVESTHYPPLLLRHPANPILTRKDWPYSINSVFNAGATLLQDGTTLLLCRIEDRRGLSHLCAARSKNGVDGWQIDREPTLMPSPKDYPEEIWGIEDPRITFVPELQQYVITYTSYSRGGPGVSLALTKNFRSFERYGVIMPPDDKDSALLPRRINGYWTLIHRPMTPLGAHMWISYSPDLHHWGRHRLMLEARRGAWWDANKIGLSPPPIETSRGWLVLYHGVRHTPSGCLYRLGLALFDLENPEKCLLRGDSWIFGRRRTMSATAMSTM
jgi:beta-1,2-mannobiose phosphorylase / 1,2-beta-oligomannan phosphorylase